MAAPQEILLEGKRFTLIRTQRGALSVYRGEGEYVRVGTEVDVRKHLALHRQMQGYGFPVPEILREGFVDGHAYCVERSLGHHSFRNIFAEDVEKNGQITDEHFREFLTITKHFLLSQFKSVSSVQQPDIFAEHIHLPTLCDELPAHADALHERFTRVTEHLKTFPYVMTHGDLNPSNMYPTGVIDLEDSFVGPLGYDVVSSLMTIDWFPENEGYEYVGRYRFNDSQKKEYKQLCDDLCSGAGHPSLSPTWEDLAFCRGVWLAARMQEWPKIQKFRHERLIATYLT